MLRISLRKAMFEFRLNLEKINKSIKLTTLHIINNGINFINLHINQYFSLKIQLKRLNVSRLFRLMVDIQ